YFKLADATLQQLNRQMQTFLGRHGQAAEILPQPSHASVYDFGINRVAHRDMVSPVSAHSGIRGGNYVLGNLDGQLLYFENHTPVKEIQTPHGAKITAIAFGDMVGDGRPDIIAGDLLGNLYCYDTDGTMKWAHVLTPNYGPI